jgi:ubiquinol-cytochrome c reductase cytochrome c1 subunit
MMSSIRIPKKSIVALSALALSGAIATKVAFASGEDSAIPPKYPWSHEGFTGSYDAASIRRGYQVYREVCSACHSMDRIAFRNLGEIAFTQKEVKTLAGEVDVWDAPDNQGNIGKRPGKSFDYFPAPYKNEQEARFSNGGALPPDLSLIVKARPHAEDYVFSLLTGYDNPPAGVQLREGLYFNAYFPGGAIGMAPPLSDGSVEYADGTPATLSQLAKDVTTFLAWTSKPEQDTRKKMGIKVITSLFLLGAISWYVKRFKWSIVKNRRIVFRD